MFSGVNDNVCTNANAVRIMHETGSPDVTIRNINGAGHLYFGYVTGERWTNDLIGSIEGYQTGDIEAMSAGEIASSVWDTYCEALGETLAIILLVLMILLLACCCICCCCCCACCRCCCKKGRDDYDRI